MQSRSDMRLSVTDQRFSEHAASTSVHHGQEIETTRSVFTRRCPLTPSARTTQVNTWVVPQRLSHLEEAVSRFSLILAALPRRSRK